jgi:cob(I)alamin adenosyltransferase
MGHRLSKIYTRTGDDGTTGLGDGTRTDKAGARVAAMGDVDELNSVLGLLLTETLPAGVREALIDVQHDLFDLGGELSIPGYEMIRPAHVARLETAIDVLNDVLPPLKEFILPGGSRAAAECHLARGVCRRAERALFHLHALEPLNAQALAYLNRLSDYLFVCARTLARADGGQEVLWRRQRSGE